MKNPRVYDPQDFRELTLLLEDLFDVGRVGDYTLLPSGFMSQNYRVNTSVGSFFLKRYRDRITTVIHEIKMAEEYFANAGLPIILPIKDRYQREAFWCGSWHSLFPFVNGISPTRQDINQNLIVSLSSNLAKLHDVGDQFTFRPFQMMRIGNKRKFLMENVELDRRLAQRPTLTPQEEQIRDILDLKRRLFQSATRSPDDFQMPYDCLIHGDYQHLNVFTKTDTITHIFDLERTALGPTHYEIVRAIILDCFEDGWEEKNFWDARLYLNVYRARRNLTLPKFTQALHYYYYNIIHTSWIEANYLIHHSEESLAFLALQQKRLLYLSSHNLDELAHSIWGKNGVRYC